MVFLLANFNKKEYDKSYVKDKTAPFKFGMSKEDSERFVTHCTNLGVNRSAYLKKLVNDDATKRGLPLVFHGRISEDK